MKKPLSVTKLSPLLQTYFYFTRNTEGFISLSIHESHQECYSKVLKPLKYLLGQWEWTAYDYQGYATLLTSHAASPCPYFRLNDIYIWHWMYERVLLQPQNTTPDLAQTGPWVWPLAAHQYSPHHYILHFITVNYHHKTSRAMLFAEPENWDNHLYCKFQLSSSLL